MPVAQQKQSGKLSSGERLRTGPKTPQLLNPTPKGPTPPTNLKPPITA